jgi:hypothetical protein
VLCGASPEALGQLEAAVLRRRLAQRQAAASADGAVRTLPGGGAAEARLHFACL